MRDAEKIEAGKRKADEWLRAWKQKNERSA
jgi:hypothetical protein